MAQPFKKLFAEQTEPLPAELQRSFEGRPAAVPIKTGRVVESLYDRVARMKHRWLSRVMYGGQASPSERCFAYLVMDHLNCVTLDSWPGKARIGERLGWKSKKTTERAARSLEEQGYLRITCSGHGIYRYAPVFLPEDMDKSDPRNGQKRPEVQDKNVHESFLIIHPISSTSTEEERKGCTNSSSAPSRYNPKMRGTYEIELARVIGADGFEILTALAAFNDAAVERLCVAYADGLLGKREIEAARLAATPLLRKRTWT